MKNRADIPYGSTKENRGNWIRLSVPQPYLFSEEAGESCDIKEIRPGLIFVEEGFTSSQDGGAWAIFEFENAVEV
ncbi:MAG: hypothetical protein ACTSRU_19690, partial [Candidatus Hodarchaeales archaeon]